MTDLPTDELFPQEGPVRPVAVEPKENSATPSLPEVASVETVAVKGSGNSSENLALTAASTAPPKASFAGRIAKVKRQTVDIRTQLDKIKFTDQ
ncbi:hypothetical protein GB2207_08476 [marine gamma proteobacterium HTCC2207]|jgi:hypothetical protein|uniref:Uncharacterized protein n=1 Tax=gamma proteobacterium HTCC2207 TaxID=314287 RepID=Q1YV78_9GAMM|nr:hypothetical protein GB2207_08476 [marine gamma proteobacterium HTCC2207] [gamma proteobacterium HTCC2207]